MQKKTRHKKVYDVSINMPKRNELSMHQTGLIHLSYHMTNSE